MTEPGEIARFDQLQAAAGDALASLADRYADVAFSLRVQIAEGSITRADAISELRGCWDLTEVGAADILDRAGTQGWPTCSRRAVVDLPPMTTTEEG